MPIRTAKFRNGANSRNYDISETPNKRKIEQAEESWALDLRYEMKYREKKEPGLKDTWKKRK